MKQIYEDYISMIGELRARRTATVTEMSRQYDELDEKFKTLECDATLHDAISKYLRLMRDCIQYTRSYESVTFDSEEYTRDNFREFEEARNVVVKLMS